ncbi:beta-ketoacyl-ACP synthase III [Haliovirga abyssi]|uniref:Beta-ketoacyl-[acyl-carrier-protein] synthase III n=1 Tax=Haliovirga abyssi TaxID=2996794 RepID=A0AAU9DDX1_9FUSO|nr:beta-ketoacyl-ACP synthase III [Haliovirga abyssi]BDU50378.1 3-oxoacyl-ACP synthase III [Haliovirga abyssi]
MKKLKSVGIVGLGSYLPEKVLTNKDLEKIVDTTDEWIKSRTGIEERRIAAKEEATSDLAIKAAKKALEDANVSPEEIDLVIVSTITPDFAFPATAAIVQDKIGASNAAAFDLEAACTGFVYGLAVGGNFIATGMYKKVLVIGSEALSRIMDWEDRNTCVLFGDGASAAVLGEVEDGYGLLSYDLGADGSGGHTLDQPGGGSRNPASDETVNKKMHYLRMKGKEVFKFAVTALPKTTLKTLENLNMTPDDVDLYVPHQANVRIIEAAAKKLKQPVSKFHMNMNKFGNTSSASIGIALDELYKNDKLKKGDNIVLVGFGAGLTYGSCLIKWSK